jgi:hypothetical protein
VVTDELIPIEQGVLAGLLFLHQSPAHPATLYEHTFPNLACCGWFLGRGRVEVVGVGGW